MSATLTAEARAILLDQFWNELIEDAAELIRNGFAETDNQEDN